jgi:hypothetical protein
MAISTSASNPSPFSKALEFKVLRDIQEFDIPSRLRNNQFSTETVTSLVANCTAELSEYDKEISRLHSAIFVLENRKKEVMKQMQNLKSLLAPVKRMPRDVMSEIFSHCDRDIVIGRDTIVAPGRVLSAVCSHWRSITLAEPTLWSVIGFDLLSKLDKDIVEKEVASFLELSKQTSLDLRLTDSYQRGDHDPTRFDAVFEALVQEVHRWKSLKVHVFVNQLPKPLLRTNLAFKRLQKLDICLDSRSTGLFDMNFATAYKLRCLKVGCDVEDLRHLNVPLEQITEFHFSSFDCDHYIRLLSECPNLTSSSFRFSAMVNEGDMVNSSIRDLTLKANDNDDIESSIYVLDQLLTPSLSTFRLSIDDERSNVSEEQAPIFFDEVLTALSRSLRLSEAKLTALYIHQINLKSTKEIISLFPDLPFLQTLEVDDRESPSPVIKTKWVRHLIINPDGESQANKGTSAAGVSTKPYLPSLKRLSLKTKGAPGIHHSTLVDLVRSRWQPFDDVTAGIHQYVASLRSVEFVLGRTKVERSDIQPLVHMAAAGLKVTLLDRNGIVI